MNRAATFKTILLEAGGLLLFWGCDAFGYGNYASAAVVLFVISNGFYRWWNALGFPRIWFLFNGLALALAILDSLARGHLWAPYESVGANGLIACMFALGATGRKPLVQEIAEQRQGKPFSLPGQNLTTFFRAYTWVWASYFFIKAGTWLWMAQNFPMEQAHALQSMIGSITLFAMIALSFQGKRLFKSLNKMGFFKTP